MIDNLDPLGAPFLEPRLFHCQIRTNGRFRVEEIANFAQDDLDPDDIMVLDGGDEVYVWVGTGSTEEEKAKSIDMAKVSLAGFVISIRLNRLIISRNTCAPIQLIALRTPLH